MEAKATKPEPCSVPVKGPGVDSWRMPHLIPAFSMIGFNGTFSQHQTYGGKQYQCSRQRRAAGQLEGQSAKARNPVPAYAGLIRFWTGVASAGAHSE
jgi:hypothetical protein